ncbi:unnamed protein product [Brassicogethes aeneus]|uniref:H15 domain-containing protein n=1 Tax=Brassicogethes aeneus TaxID=1431903 RepID=A0A9P0BEB1_BRAAE|nr:unnamed protein product [Brassicogethes aeneus]
MKTYRQKLLPQVMQVIADLAEANGSTMKSISTQLQGQNLVKPNNLPVQVKRALKQGLETGLIKQRSGKYRLGLDAKDYAIYKSFMMMEETGSKHHRRKRKKIKRRRKHKEYNSDSDVSIDDTQNDSDDTEYAEDDYPDDEKSSRKNRKFKSRGKTRRRKQRKNVGKSDKISSKTAQEDYTKNDAALCDNPDCLCNMKLDKHGTN